MTEIISLSNNFLAHDQTICTLQKHKFDRAKSSQRKCHYMLEAVEKNTDEFYMQLLQNYYQANMIIGEKNFSLSLWSAFV